MSFFNSSVPVLSKKKITQDVQLLPGSWHFHWQIGDITLFSGFYTRLDQACILWGAISAAIFITAQFFPLSWTLQAVLWSILSLIGTVAMVRLTWFRVKRESLQGVLYSWVTLMSVGVIITDLSIFLGWGQVLMSLCSLWLGLIALAYFCTGFGMRSRAFLLTGMVHLLSIFILPYVGAWQFLTTGGVMGASVLLLAEFRWDMSYGFSYNLATSAQSMLNQ